jgi:hypothetical protein
MTSHRWSKISRKPGEAGQAIMFVLLAMGFVLLGAIAFSVDMGNLWFHRQSAQNVADSSCTAAAMDMLFTANGGGAKGGFTPGTNFSCSGSPGAAPCSYATKNMGYAPSSLTAGTPGYDVAFTFPTTVAGLPTCTTGTGAPAVCNDPTALTNNFVQVNVDDRVRLSFAGLLSGSTTTDVGAQARCGVVLANSPIPILVLDPRNETSLSGNGNFSITIVGGPQRSIQVNANSTSAVSISGGSGAIDLTQGGPGPSFGSDFGVTGSTPRVGNFQTANSGQWIDPTPAISDPFATIQAPSTVPPAPVPPTGADAVPGCAAIPCHVTPPTHGCQDTINGCELYTAGLYTTANAINTFKKVLLFEPGVYYMQSDLSAAAHTCMRPGTGVGDGSGGTMMYFSGTHTLSVGANSGTWGVCGDTTTKVPLSQIRCINSGTGTTILPANVVTNGGLIGNVLLGPCQAPTAGGTNYGDPLGPNDPLGEQRGMLFFQDRSANLAAAGNQPSWGGGGAFGLTGVMYFHYCNSADGAGKGTNCNAGAYTDQLSLQGVAASNTFVIGDIITDKLSVGGTPTIEMDLNPNALFYVFKASLLP